MSTVLVPVRKRGSGRALSYTITGAAPTERGECVGTRGTTSACRTETRFVTFFTHALRQRHTTTEPMAALSSTTRNSLVRGGIPLLIAIGVMLAIDYGPRSPPAYAADVLSIATANVGADLLIVAVAFYSGIVSQTSLLLEWYTQYGLSAMIADTFVGILYMLIAYEIAQVVDADMRLSTYGFLAVAVQWVGDLLFAGLFVAVPRGRNVVFDLFKDYAREAQLGALLGDSFLVVVAVVYAAALTRASERHVVYVLLVQLYLVPYLVHARRPRAVAPPPPSLGAPPPRRIGAIVPSSRSSSLTGRLG